MHVCLCTHTTPYPHTLSHQLTRALTQFRPLPKPSTPAVAPLTPRARAWVGTMSLPQDQSTHVALALADNLYTSVDIIVEEHPDTLLALPGFELVKAGAKVVLRKKLAELKVRFLCNLV